jgi:hypothetical protein
MVLGTPLAAVTIAGEFASHAWNSPGAPGMADWQSPAEQALCQCVIDSEEKLVLGGTRLDLRMSGTCLAGAAGVVTHDASRQTLPVTARRRLMENSGKCRSTPTDFPCEQNARNVRNVAPDPGGCTHDIAVAAGPGVFSYMERCWPDATVKGTV